jgi:hypothetical protein
MKQQPAAPVKIENNKFPAPPSALNPAPFQFSPEIVRLFQCHNSGPMDGNVDNGVPCDLLRIQIIHHGLDFRQFRHRWSRRSSIIVPLLKAPSPHGPDRSGDGLTRNSADTTGRSESRSLACHGAVHGAGSLSA